MKKFLSLLMFALIATVAYGQSTYQDVVYLKNGSIIRGQIFEQIPNETIKIETADKSVFVYAMDEVEKMVKEEVNIAKQEPTKTPKTLKNKKGYIGFSIGAAIPMGDFADATKTGSQVSLVNFGYLFSKNFGIAANWYGAALPINDDYNDLDPISFGGIMSGPLVSFPIAEKFNLDLRPMIGYAATTLENDFIETSATSFAYSVGTQIRLHLGRVVSLVAFADYFATEPEFDDFDIKLKTETLSLGLGLAFRL